MPDSPRSDACSDRSRIFDLAGRTALVTGASRGIGRAIALGLAAFGSAVAVHGSTESVAAAEVRDLIIKQGRRAVCLPADLSNPGEGQRLARAATEAMGAIDILVVNAAIEIEQPIADVTKSAFDQQINVNLRATFELMQALLPEMAERRWGRVVTIGSVQQVTPNPRKAIYAASKSAQANLAVSMARAYAAHGVTVNNVAPGLILTDRTRGLEREADRWQRKLQEIPVGYAGAPDDVVGAVILLCSDAGRYITAQDFLVDGGLGLSGARGR